MSRVKRIRKRFLVDPKVQGALVMRVLLYWVVCLITITLMLLCWSVLHTPRIFYTHFGDMWVQYGPALIASLVLLPMVIVDIIRFSNRFTGPLVRLRRSMRALARGEHVEPIHFREDDFWREFAEEFNAVAARVQGETRRAESASQTGSREAREGEEFEEPEPVGAAD